jgi:hypothetical protein
MSDTNATPRKPKVKLTTPNWPVCSTCGDERGNCPDCQPAPILFALAEYFNNAIDVREWFGAQYLTPSADRCDVSPNVRFALAHAEKNLVDALKKAR